MAFYHFSQNNSGGEFLINDKVTINVVIEANNANHANELANVVGIYFDGCNKGFDCSCCGDRWYRVSEYDATEFPAVYGEPVETADHWAVNSGDVAAYVYYLDRPKMTVYKK